MVIRHISVRLYVAAAALVLVVIFIGWAVAALVNLGRLNELERRWSHQEAAWQHLQQLHAEMLRRPAPEGCAAPRAALLASVESTDGIRQRLDRYLASPFRDSNGRVIELKQELGTATLAHWEMATTLREACGSRLPPLLYLYSGKSCSQCSLQTKILRVLEGSHHPELLVFPVDVDFAPPEQIDRLRSLYAVTSLPATIISKTSYSGFLSRGTLQKILVPDIGRRPS